MNFEEFKNALEKEISKMNLQNTRMDLETETKLFNYMNKLIEKNKEFNLTAITNEQDIIVKHFIDSMTINQFINDGESLIDVGTGAGFPRKHKRCNK